MSKQIRKLVSSLLLLTLIFTMLPITALAASNPVTIHVEDESGNPIEEPPLLAPIKAGLAVARTSAAMILSNRETAIILCI